MHPRVRAHRGARAPADTARRTAKSTHNSMFNYTAMRKRSELRTVYGRLMIGCPI